MKTFEDIHIGATFYLLSTTDMTVYSDVVVDYSNDMNEVTIHGNKWSINDAYLKFKHVALYTGECDFFEVYLDYDSVKRRIEKLAPWRVSDVIEALYDFFEDEEEVNEIVDTIKQTIEEMTHGSKKGSSRANTQRKR